MTINFQFPDFIKLFVGFRFENNFIVSQNRSNWQIKYDITNVYKFIESHSEGQVHNLHLNT